MDLNWYRESIDKQMAGAPIYIGDVCFTVKRYGTKESNEVLRDIRKALFGPFHKASPDDDNLVHAEWLCWAVTGWNKLLTEGGKPVPFTPDAARNIFTNPEYFLSLNAELILLAMRFEFFLHEEMQEDEEQIKKP